MHCFRITWCLRSIPSKSSKRLAANWKFRPAGSWHWNISLNSSCGSFIPVLKALYCCSRVEAENVDIPSVFSSGMSMTGETTWVGKKPTRRLGGMSDALSIASDLGFKIPQEDGEGLSSNSDRSDDLIRVLRELTAVQRNIANLQVELHGRKDDKNVAHLTHVSEMEKKCESLARITSILKDVIQNKDRIIARLQQPYSQDCIPVEAEYQKQFSELLLRAASDYQALTASVGDFQWSQNFREPPSIWGEMLRPIPIALASCTRFFEAISTMRESFAMLQQLRVGQSSLLTTLAKDHLQEIEDAECMTPSPWRNTSNTGSHI